MRPKALQVGIARGPRMCVKITQNDQVFHLFHDGVGKFFTVNKGIIQSGRPYSSRPLPTELFSVGYLNFSFGVISLFTNIS